jgi:hypothetical protein
MATPIETMLCSHLLSGGLNQTHGLRAANRHDLRRV